LLPIVEAAARANPRIVYRGSLSREELVRTYAQCHVLVIPSLREVFSVVSSEGLASGLFTVASSASGEAADLIHPNLNGCVVDPSDAHALAKSLSLAADRVRGGLVDPEAISDSLGEHSPETYAESIMVALRLAALGSAT
jgi:glycosyltransferase involved in cell wall biosynthesis